MLEFSETALQDAVNAYVGIEEFLHRVRTRVGAVEPGQWTPRFAAALNDDLAVPTALAEVHHTRAEGNRALDAGRPRRALAAPRDPGDDGHSRLRPARRALGVARRDVGRAGRRSTCWCGPSWSAARQARVQRDWKLADEIRDRLKDAGIEVTDTADGPQWRWGQNTTPMAGNSQRRGAIRKAGTKKGPTVGSGGQRRRGLEGRGRHSARPHAPQPPGRQARAGHSRSRPASAKTTRLENVLGRNPVLECLRAGVPATALYVALGAEADERLTESVSRGSRFRHRDPRGAAHRPGPDDHQRPAPGHRAAGAAVQLRRIPTTCSAAVADSPPALLVALDNISDPRNLGAIVRSVAAFGGHGVLIPQRRSASVTAWPWRTSAGAAARIPVARATNLNRTLKDWADRGLQVVGLDADGDTWSTTWTAPARSWWSSARRAKGCPGWSADCDAVVSIPMSGRDESLNAWRYRGSVRARLPTYCWPMLLCVRNCRTGEDEQQQDGG